MVMIKSAYIMDDNGVAESMNVGLGLFAWSCMGLDDMKSVWSLKDMNNWCFVA
jgi:hypothetical protein